MPLLFDIKNPRVYLTLIAVVALYAVAIFIRNQFVGDILTMIFLFGALSLSWNILGGYAGQFSLGHAGLFGIGAYTSTLLFTHYGLNPWLGMIIGGVLASIAGGLIFYPCFRLRGIFFCLASLAFTEVMRILATHFRGLTEGSMGITIPFKAGLSHMMFREKNGYIIIALSLMLIIAFVSLLIKRSRLGYKLVALREDEDTTETLGVSTANNKFIATLISGFFTGCLGTFYAHYTLLIDPESVFSVMLSVELALLAILGGIGTVMGPIVGAFLLIPIDSLVRGYIGQAQQGLSFIVYGGLLVIVVLFIPDGVISWLSKLSEKIFQALPGGARQAALPIPRPTAITKDEPKPRDRETDVHLLEIKQLGKSFGGLRVINDLDVTVYQGEILGLIGPNGAGKTTLFNLVTGVHRSDSGSIVFKQNDITKLSPPHKVARLGVARTFQVVKPLAGLSVEDNVLAGAVERSPNYHTATEKAREIIGQVGLEKYVGVKAGSLTLAARKRLELARALATEPDLLLLDEVMAGLNPTEVDEAIELIRKISKRGVTLLVIEHVMKAIMSLADRIVTIHHGEKIFEGTPEQASKDEQVIKAYLGKEYRIC